MDSGNTGVVEAPNFFELEVGELSPARKKIIIELLRMFMEGMRKILVQSQNILACCGSGVTIREPCRSCAFNPMTDGARGFAPTAYGLLRAVHRDALFLCHDNQPGWAERKLDPNKLELCAGLAKIRITRPKRAFRLAERTMKALEQILGREIKFEQK